MKRFYLPLFLIAILGLSSACGDLDDSPKALVNVLLIDAPAQWDSVIVEVQGVELEFVPNGREGEVERLFIPYEPADKQIDVSQLVGGTALPLGRTELQLGNITGVTLRLGPSNSLFLGETRYPLALPEGQTDYFQEIAIDLEEGFSYDLILDLDLEKSIQVTQPDPLTLKFNPTVNAYSGIGRGDLSGTISPTELSPAVYVIQDKDSTSTHTDVSSKFIFRLNPGTYTLYIDPKDSRYKPETIRGVTVEAGKNKVLDRITLSKK